MGIAKTPDDSGDKPPVALIAGPTASGKSGTALRTAYAFDKRGVESVIVNADSMQVYRDLGVVTAAPTESEANHYEHRLYGMWDGARPGSAADWAKEAKEVIAEVHSRGAIPILCGGTGLYIRTLLDGIAPIPEIELDLRRMIRALDPADAYAALQAEDPERAARLEPGDSQRIARALEVVRSTGRTMGDWQQLMEGGIANRVALFPLILLPPREVLYERCHARFAAMLDGGAIEEVEALLARGLTPELPVMRAIGVPEIAAMLRGELTRDECIAKAAQATRNYAKRQYTWFGKQPPADWPRVEATPDAEAFVAAMHLW